MERPEESVQTLVKIKTYRLGFRGQRGYLMSVPRSWVEDNGLRRGMRLDVYGDTSGRLVVVPAKRRRREVTAEATA